MKVKKRAWIKKLGFTVLTGDRLLSRMKFRVNIYIGKITAVITYRT